jgi:hypothetical protein
VDSYVTYYKIEGMMASLLALLDETMTTMKISLEKMKAR